MTAVVREDELARLRGLLMKQARLFEDPNAYVAGVEDTIAAVRMLLSGEQPSDDLVLTEEPSGRMI